jgi:hypothetical protein
MQPRSRVLRGCSASPALLPRSPQLCQNGDISVLSSLWETEESRVPWTTVVLVKKNPWWERKYETVHCSDATARSFVTNVRGEVFSHFHVVAVKRHSSMRNWLFGLPGRILSEQSVKENDEHALDFALHLPRHFRSRWVCTFRVRLLLSSPNACLIIARVSVALFPRFAQNLTYTRRSCVRSIAKSHQARYTTPNKTTRLSSSVKFCTLTPKMC